MRAWTVSSFHATAPARRTPRFALGGCGRPAAAAVQPASPPGPPRPHLLGRLRRCRAVCSSPQPAGWFGFFATSLKRCTVLADLRPALLAHAGRVAAERWLGWRREVGGQRETPPARSRLRPRIELTLDYCSDAPQALTLGRWAMPVRTQPTETAPSPGCIAWLLKHVFSERRGLDRLCSRSISPPVGQQGTWSRATRGACGTWKSFHCTLAHYLSISGTHLNHAARSAARRTRGLVFGSSAGGPGPDLPR